jgi:hypothetical protein
MISAVLKLTDIIFIPDQIQRHVRTMNYAIDLQEQLTLTYWVFCVQVKGFFLNYSPLNIFVLQYLYFSLLDLF